VTIAIRSARKADSAALRVLLSRAWRDAYAPRVGHEAVRKLIAEALSDTCLGDQIGRDHVLVACDADGTLSGCLFARLLPQRVEIGRLYVDMNAKRRGIGRALIYHLAGTAGPRPIELTVVADNLEARAFYEALGFTQIGTKSFDFAGVPIPTLVLERAVPQT
jgi:ribosomal protein S18 acetylase RimI-like enzyme